MSYLFLEYPKCSTCKKAKKWLEDNKIQYTSRMIVEDNPTKEEIEKWYKQSGLSINKFFNTSGKLYKEMNLKDTVKTASEEELINILATNGMLVKRPLLVLEDKVLIGFKEDKWSEALK